VPRAEVEQTGQVGDERVLDGQELRMCLHHPGWLVGKLEHVGPVKREADLALSDDPLPRTLETTVRQNAHVLGPLNPQGLTGHTSEVRQHTCRTTLRTMPMSQK
jgi:hypothetical protein